MWEASSKLVTPSDITVYANRTASVATYRTTVTRRDLATIYTVVGAIAIGSTQSTPISGALILLGGLPPGSPSSFPVVCPKGQNATSTIPLICPFAVELAIPPRTITGQARRAGTLSFVLSPSKALTFPTMLKADNGQNCVSLLDTVTAGAATSGIKAAGIITPLNLPGVPVCKNMPVEYSVAVGPFADGCGTYQVSCTRPEPWLNLKQKRGVGRGACRANPKAG
jgi:hypothetical protein